MILKVATYVEVVIGVMEMGYACPVTGTTRELIATTCAAGGKARRANHRPRDYLVLQLKRGRVLLQQYMQHTLVAISLGIFLDAVATEPQMREKG